MCLLTMLLSDSKSVEPDLLPDAFTIASVKNPAVGSGAVESLLKSQLWTKTENLDL